MMSPDRRRFVKPASTATTAASGASNPWATACSWRWATTCGSTTFGPTGSGSRSKPTADAPTTCGRSPLYGDTYWCGTFGSGLLCINPSTGDLRRITTAEGLASNIVYQTAIRQDTLWCATDFGISYVALSQTPDRASTIRSDGAYISRSGVRRATVVHLLFGDLPPRSRQSAEAAGHSASPFDRRLCGAVTRLQSSSELVCGGFMGVNRVDIGQSVADETPGRLVFCSLLIHNRPIRPGGFVHPPQSARSEYRHRRQAWS